MLISYRFTQDQSVSVAEGMPYYLSFDYKKNMNGPNARRSFRVRYIRQSQKFQFCNISIAEVQLKTSLTPGIFNRKGEGREGGIGRGKIYHSLNSSLNNCRLLALRRGNGSPAISTRAFKRSSYSCGIRQPRGH